MGAEGQVSVAVASTILGVTLVAFIAMVWLAGYASKAELINPTKDLIAAFHTQRWWSLACSFFAAAFGASALMANPEAGATGGWIQVFAYGIANASPYFVLAAIGPRIQEYLGDNGGFTIADFVHKRYGLPMFIPTVVLSLGFLFIWLTAELTSIAGGFSLLSPDFYAPAAVMAVAFGVAIYALFGGFRGSILTDRVQALMALVCTVVLVVAVVCCVHTTKADWSNVDVPVGQGLSGAIVLILSTSLNQFLDLGSWQRVFASEDRCQAKIGLIVAGCVNFFCQSLMTFMGIFAVAAAAGGKISLPAGEEGLAFYSLLQAIPQGFNVIALLCVIILSVSTVDSIENSLASAFANVLLKDERSLNWSRLLALLMISAAVALATTNQSVLSLFLLSNIFSACIVPPIFLGLSTAYATTAGALSGFVSAVVTIFVTGWIVQKSFVEGLKWPMFPRGFSHWTTLLTFLLCPLVATIVTIGVSRAFPSKPKNLYDKKAVSGRESTTENYYPIS